MPPSRAHTAKAALYTLRPHHWPKNLLLIVPMVMAHLWNDVNALSRVGIGFLCFCLMASAIYIVNDLFDLPADRAHPTKCRRPLAAGDLRIPHAIFLAALLFLAAVGLAFLIPGGTFVLLLIGYAATAVLYSMSLKRMLVLDVVVLAGLYTLRILAGGAAVGVSVSAWLLAFSTFFFLSLAIAKRYAEIAFTAPNDKNSAMFQARPYLASDLDLFRSTGPCCGLLSVLVLALYINSSAVSGLYRHPQILWFICPVLLYWILRIWFLVLRTKAGYDPVILALKDPSSYVVVVATACLLFGAT